MRGHAALYLKNQTPLVRWPTPHRWKPLTTLSSVHSYCLFVNSFIPVTLNDWWVDQSSPDWGAAWQAVKVTLQAHRPRYMSAFFYLAMGYEKEGGETMSARSLNRWGAELCYCLILSFVPGLCAQQGSNGFSVFTLTISLHIWSLSKALLTSTQWHRLVASTPPPRTLLFSACCLFNRQLQQQRRDLLWWLWCRAQQYTDKEWNS